MLSSDEFEGRGPNTAGETKTVNYLIEQFKAAGLKPGGDLAGGKRSWTQDVPLGRFEIKGPVTLTLNDGKKAQTLTQGDDMAVRAAMNGAKKVDFKNAPLVFVGYGVTAPERKWDDFKGMDLKGKLAIVLINDPDFETGKGEFGGKAMTYYGRWTYKFEEMARRGALGTIIVHETAPASYGWPTVKNSNTNVMYDIVRKEPRKAHAPMEAWIQRDLVADMFKRAGLDFEAAKKQAQIARLQAGRAEGHDAVGQLRGRCAGHQVEERGRRARRQQAPEPVRDVQRPLGPPGRWPAGCQGRQDLQRRGRQRDRHCRHAGTGARLRQAAGAASAAWCSWR